MPTKLTDLKITKVDFVDAGANQRAHIALFKHAPKGGEEVGESKIKSLIRAIAKRFGLEEDEVADVAKSEGGAKTFGAANSELKQQRVCEEIWNVTDALRSSLFSIIRDDTVADKTALLKQSVSEFHAAALGFANQWGDGNIAEVQKHMNPIAMTAEDIAIMKSRVAAMTEESVKETEPVMKAEEDAEMKIDKSKMTAEERAFFEDIEKRYGAPETEVPPAPTVQPTVAVQDAPVQKSAAEVLKDVMPEFAAMLENVQKRMEKQEDAEIMEVAKRYELLGKKPEELAPVLKSTKAASEEAYNQIVTALDAALDIAKRSGMFNEIGSNGNGGATDAEARIAKRVEEIRKAHPEMSVFVARDMAFQENPELIAEFE
jgi:hypothetical protein|nr:MAG TPA: hypothetical protein [Caudoviricetes sp.]